MDYRIDIVQGATKAVPVTHIANHETQTPLTKFQALRHVRLNMFRPGIDDYALASGVLEQVTDEMLAEVAGAACHQYAMHVTYGRGPSKLVPPPGNSAPQRFPVRLLRTRR